MSIHLALIQDMPVKQHYNKTLEQGIDFLITLSDQGYLTPKTPGWSPVGRHFRHIIDHFLAIKTAMANKVVNYDQRHRGSKTERNRALAIQQLQSLQHWLTELDDAILDQPVIVTSDIGIGKCCQVSVQSTVGRELMFACSHAIHHYALIKQLTDNQSQPSDFGLAPATASFERRLNQ
ncbi:DinB family protein [Lacimicrobium alkaliphilum]|uniref:DinB-like domain-containing protein n=1 Tax=Lacimicrobium alkaliphilum TaxID=1526571 RepID=A0ABQ1RHD0_9ALTE|nr:DinB family protein [Lacimicrobium alkaliphilum]GGD66566.1 hypothetical protein GCM10011357_22290 [Lacimicrobium alkaliphilum]